MNDTLTVQSPAAARAAAGLPGADRDIGMTRRAQARYYLEALRDRNGRGHTELRILRADRSQHPQQHFYAPPDVRRVAAESALLWADAGWDVYAGVLPRAARAGGKANLLPDGHVVWAECDTPTAVDRAMGFHTPPSLVVRSSPGKAHAYWFCRPNPIELIEVANRRLAFELGADPKATDAARILRVPGTFNWKYPDRPPVEVCYDNWRASVPLGALVGDLPDPSPPLAAGRRGRGVMRSTWTPTPDGERDALLEIPSRRYVPALAGREAVRGMVQCPFHSGGNERTPSLHVGGANETLWYCFGCGEGGDLFTFAARLWGMDVRRDFPAVKKRLGEVGL